jgi:hypothetical protein
VFSVGYGCGTPKGCETCSGGAEQKVLDAGRNRVTVLCVEERILMGCTPDHDRYGSTKVFGPSFGSLYFITDAVSSQISRAGLTELGSPVTGENRNLPGPGAFVVGGPSDQLA